MARALVPALDTLAGPFAQRRRPQYEVSIYDIRSTAGDPTPTRINDVVLDLLPGSVVVLPAIVGPRDFTGDVQNVEVIETGPDYVSTGVAASTIVARVIDAYGALDPVENPAPADGRWLRQGNVVVLREGDAEVDPSLWPITFVGAIVGQPAQSRNRTTGESLITFKASSREVNFLRRESTSRNYLQGSLYTDIVDDIAQVDMGLDPDEINIGAFSSQLTEFRSTQFVQESPLISIAKIMFEAGFMPRFQGDGRLGVTDGSLTKGATRIYEEFETQITIERPILEFDGTNEVEIIGLNANMNAVVQHDQVLATASCTSGFFTSKITLPVKWSEDGTQQAFDARLHVISSVADGVLEWGSEDFVDFPEAPDGGSTHGEIRVDGALDAGIIIAVSALAGWIAAAAIPDSVIVGGFIASSGITISVGRLIQAIAGGVLINVLSQVGFGQYEILGKPYEYVFEEIRAVARVAGIRSEDRKVVTIENHLLTSQASCDAVAERVLRRERAKQNLRSLTMLHDLKVEVDDVIELGSGLDARRFVVTSISRTLERGGDVVAKLDAFEITAGVRP